MLVAVFMHARRLAEMTYVEVRELLANGLDTAILPVGTVEPHGPHLPLGTDCIIPELIAERLAERLNAVILPTVNYGVTNSLHGYPGSIRVRPDVLENLVYDILASLSLHGFKIAVILNGHGGNTSALDSAARRAWLDHRLAVLLVDWWRLARERGLTQRILGKEGGHAATDETALVAAARPELVKSELYSPEEVFLASQGVQSYPAPGTILNYSPTEGEVSFDTSRAQEYLDEIVREVGKLYDALRSALERMKH